MIYKVYSGEPRLREAKGQVQPSQTAQSRQHAKKSEENPYVFAGSATLLSVLNW